MLVWIKSSLATFNFGQNMREPFQTDREAAKRVNNQYYAQVLAGREDYWNLMAGPRHRLAVLLKELQAQSPKNLVDLGCGNGVLLGEIKRHFPLLKLTGIDLSSDQIELNRGADKTIAWHVQDLERESRLPEGLSAAFDVVIASEIIEHLGDPRRFLENAGRLAKPSGALLLSTQSGPIHETERRVGHARHFTREEMLGLLRSSGWEQARIWNTGYPFHDMSKWFANLNPDHAMRAFSGEPYGWTQKAVCWGLRLAFLFNSSKRGRQLFAVARKNGF